MKTLQFAVFSFLLILAGPLFADDNGQIININQNYQIAFTDLGSRVLNQGDLVKVSLNADEFLYLQVLESSPILSKLGISKVEGFQTNINDFQRMTVGNEVVKIKQTQEKAVETPAETTESKDTVALSEMQIQKLEGDLALAKEEIKRLEESNEESKVKLSELASESQTKVEEPAVLPPAISKDTLGQIKSHLDNMRKLIDENN